MMHLWRVLVFGALCLALTTPADAQLYADYAVGRPDSAWNVPYSSPAFSGTPYWLKYWKTLGRFATTEPLGEGQIWQPIADGWDGIEWDSLFVRNAEVGTDGRACFVFVDDQGRKLTHYFPAGDVTQDVRLTNVWRVNAQRPARCLWTAVERAALTREHPDVTWAIVEHMVRSGVVRAEEFRRMSSSRIVDAMLDYSDIALWRNLADTETIVRVAPLPTAWFDSLHVADTVLVYYKERYGPTPVPALTLVVATPGSYAVTTMPVGATFTIDITRHSFFARERYVVVVPAS